MKKITFEWQKLPSSLNGALIADEKTKQAITKFLTEKAETGYVAIMVDPNSMFVLFKVEKVILKKKETNKYKFISSKDE